MSAKLFNEPQQSGRPRHQKTIKKIDDLILDAEIEAQAEINKKIRSNNTRMLLLALVGVGLLYALYSGVQNQTIPMPSFLIEEAQVAKTPSAPKPTPIPFPVAKSTSVTKVSAPSLNEQQKKNLSPLENEVMSMIQKKLGEPENADSGLKPGSAELSQQASPKTQSTSPFAPAEATRSTPNSASNPKEEVAAPFTPQSAAPRLTATQSEFFIQVGAFSVKTNADRVIKKLMSGGFSPLIQTRTTRSSMHVVFIGGFADEQSPQSMITELKNKGLNPTLKKNDNGSYSIILGKERSKERAETLKQKLTKQGIFTSLKQMKVNMRMFIVRVGGFQNNTNALQGQKKLKHLGYNGTLIRKKS
jgi:cell division protein FtsN